MNYIDKVLQDIAEFVILFSLGYNFNELLSDTLNEVSIFDNLFLVISVIFFILMVGVIAYMGIRKRNRRKLYYILVTLLITGVCIYTAIK